MATPFQYLPTYLQPGINHDPSGVYWTLESRVVAVICAMYTDAL